jgi:hypothetical protein
MPIKPIDLQTLFMQLGQVGREQFAEKEGAALQGAVKAAADLKRREEAKEAVRGPEDPQEGTVRVQDRQARQETAEGRERGREAKPEEEAPREEVVKDPGLGTKLDISG